ncbi:hypothetical protein [Streptomyces himastatinicus]|uniref:hypothetical protein n=1 Tax=Streptomyces himastatinicus TaxID=998084 RepID=UPI0001B4D6DE|nr:hypothetical protein [Streptomyces himastatinicus]
MNGQSSGPLRITLGAQAVQSGGHPGIVDVDFVQFLVLEAGHDLRVGDHLDPGERFEDLPLGTRSDPPPHAAHAVVVQSEEGALVRGIVTGHGG